MEELFRSGTLAMSSDPISGMAAGPAWAELPGNRILAVAAVVLLVISLPELFRIAPQLGYALTRPRGAADLEHSLGTARARNAVALVFLLPFCLLADRYALFRPAFLSRIPAPWSPAAVFGLTAGYLLLRRCCHAVFRPRRLNAEQSAALRHIPYSHFIPLTALLLFTTGVLAPFHAPDSLVRSILGWECAAAAVLCLFRAGQFLRGDCSVFATIMYLCGLEIIPAAAFAALIVFF